MGKKKKKKAKKTDPQLQSQAGLLIDRLIAQDPNGETLDHFLKSLRESLSANRELAVVFVDELGKLKSEIAGKVIKEIEELFDDKKYRKAVKRARFRLVQKGILKEEEPEKDGAGTVRYIVSSVDKPLSLCYFAVLEPIGEEMIFVYIPGGADKDTIIQFILNQTRQLGLLAYEKAYYKRSMARELVHHLENSYKTKFFEIPLSYAAYLFEEGLLQGVIEGGGKVKEAERELKKYFKPDTFPLVYEHVSRDEVEVSRELLEKATRLLSDASFPLKVLPPEDEILPADKLRSVFESTLIVSPTTRKEQMDDIMREAIVDYFAGEKLDGFLRCLEEVALYCCLNDEKDKALCILAVVKDLRENRENISANMFLKKLFFRTAAIILRDVLTENDFEFYFEESFDEFQETDTEEEQREGLIIVPK